MERKLGVNTWVWTSPLTDDALPELAARISSLGFTAIELPLENLGDWDPKRTRDVLAKHSLAPVLIGAMSPGRNLVSAPDAEIAATQNYLRGLIDAAATLGATTVAGPFYAATGRTWSMNEVHRRATYSQLRENLAPLAAHAAEQGVALAIEPLNRYETSLINTVDQALDALEPLLGPGLGIALDSYHLNIEEQDIAAAVARATGHIAHVQVCGNDRGTVGADHFDWHGFIRALDLAGYGGPLCVESFTPDNASIAVAASIWRPLASTQDALAADSLGYLKNLQIGGLR
ncbi:sugar phosphate isomerase/epimerase family protein [Paeniglutamicibacter psychrophenolicus]|uniref:sugar phosphate isomerase/epimerase family protein n=1 Tax=Paeniglutamicibacter psychrophenolicus TaxID=257454 RepID=UPI002784B60A|nr:sugar phosphate isomerase/epimerase family protein [Paeniglutamicibacter psychrophenolicus]MDQ0094177.1 D-psicose/D-tagatose/L-ribulose 3-epimerase [Paeniglutamicibacter psychrophenolicus]